MQTLVLVFAVVLSMATALAAGAVLLSLLVRLLSKLRSSVS